MPQSTPCEPSETHFAQPIRSATTWFTVLLTSVRLILRVTCTVSNHQRPPSRATVRVGKKGSRVVLTLIFLPSSLSLYSTMVVTPSLSVVSVLGGKSASSHGQVASASWLTRREVQLQDAEHALRLPRATASASGEREAGTSCTLRLDIVGPTLAAAGDRGVMVSSRGRSFVDASSGTHSAGIVWVVVAGSR